MSSTRNQKMVLAAAVVTSFITSFCASALNLAVPQIEARFFMGATAVGWIVTLYMMIIAAFAVVAGKVADRTSRRTMLIVGAAMFAAASIGCMLSWNAASLLVFRGLQGVAASLIFATNMPIVMSVYPPQRRGFVIGTCVSGTYTGLSLGPVLGGLFTQHLGWQAVFAFSAFAALVSLVMILVGMKPEKQDPATKGQFKLDIVGAALYAIAIMCLVYGLSSFTTTHAGWICLVAFVVLGAVFIRWERKVDDPVVNVRLFAKDAMYGLSNLTALLHYCATSAASYLLSIYLQVSLGMSSQVAGFVLLAQPIFMAVLSPVMGRLSDKYSAFKIATAGMGLSAVSMIMFAFIPQLAPVWFILLGLALTGVGAALFSSPNTNVIMSRVAPEDFGAANSILSSMRTTGQSVGMAIVTLVTSVTLGNVSLYSVTVPQMATAVRGSFLVFAVLCVAATIVSFCRRRAE